MKHWPLRIQITLLVGLILALACVTLTTNSIYSAKDNDGFLTEPAIKAMRSELAHSIFRQEFANLYEGQNKARADLKAETTNVMRELLC